MRTYAAVGAVSKQHCAILQGAEYPNLLFSYYYDKTANFADRVGYPFPHLLLDSGAFSAVTVGAAIDLDAYIEWCKAYSERYPYARITNLDVIPDRKKGTGEFHWIPEEKTIKKSVKAGARNAEKIRAAGLRVIEVYHLFEPLSVWRSIIERRREGEVLGIGGLGHTSWGDRSYRRIHGDACFAVIKEMCGWDAVPPIHAFGGVTNDIPWRYPVSSCDASSWISPARWGQRAGRGGKLLRGGAKAHQLLNKDFATTEGIKILEGWRERDEQTKEHWRRRGVNILPEGQARVSEPVS